LFFFRHYHGFSPKLIYEYKNILMDGKRDMERKI